MKQKRLYRLEIIYPEGSHAKGWRPACWSDPAYLQSLSRQERRELRNREFKWPRNHDYQSSSGAYARANLLRWYGAEAEVLPSNPVTWPNYDDWSSFGENSWDDSMLDDGAAYRWHPDLELVAEHQRRQLAGKIASGDLPADAAREILGELEMRELAKIADDGESPVWVWTDEAAQFADGDAP
jgi:hypothetical protein